ncbi:MAG: two-component system response regulator [Sulfurimicrobium sp.]|nr:two-component system response regulator [Sulfurimicrobium sp.]MDP1703650.1 two-component system response regulator [Sulfurimicrobium sp.]MDP2199374.1 two-component system response regulator [Sulfurimicrobium sp.]MDP3688754.1 two-component system response regulator [Sulfurimicrobium sp.]
MTNSSKPVVLIVDDMPENIDVLRGILAQDYTLRIATNGELALKIANASPPDLVLLDVMMPVMDGYEVCRQLKENESTRHVPVIFVTAMGDVEAETRGFEIGAVDYITKPVSPPVVRARVMTHLALYDQQRHLEGLVRERTAALENSNQQLEETRFAIITQLGRAAEYRDNETGQHIMRVGHFSQMLALAAGFTDARAKLLMHASMMHDVGKIGIPDRVLLKPGKLTLEEFEVIKTHPAIGAEIIGEHDSALLMMARELALSHHEKWDGSGYPLGLKGDAIPISGRIVAIVDVFDALASRRPYKQNWLTEKAFEYIREKAATHFDPELAHLFLERSSEVLRIMERFSDEAAGSATETASPESQN